MKPKCYFLKKIPWQLIWNIKIYFVNTIKVSNYIWNGQSFDIKFEMKSFLKSESYVVLNELKNFRVDIPSGTTQRWVCLNTYHVFLATNISRESVVSNES